MNNEDLLDFQRHRGWKCDQQNKDKDKYYQWDNRHLKADEAADLWNPAFAKWYQS